MTDWLDEIRRKREALLADPGLPDPWASRWRAHHERWGRANADAVAAIEAREGCALPEEYRRFLIEIADGGMGPGEGLFSLEESVQAAPEWTGALAAPFGYQVIEGRRGCRPTADDGKPGGSLLLAHTGCGCFDILVVTGDDRGTIWGLDHHVYRFVRDERPVGFFDWYERWLDSGRLG